MSLTWRARVDILCDIMQHATLPEAELEKGLDIRREIDMGQDDPVAGPVGVSLKPPTPPARTGIR